MTARIGILGGSGLYGLTDLKDVREERIATPFGEPSDAFLTGELSGIPVAFLARHGRGHRIAPSAINYRANIFAFKKLGCDAIFSASAVGSLKEELAPAGVCIPSQFIDRTRSRANSFFGNGIVVHVSLADPVCKELAALLVGSCRAVGAKVQDGGTYVCMEGPQFSTRAESNLFRTWGADVIGMTNMTEARLAREAEICYATMALVTDYDCWRASTEAVSVDAVLAVLRENAETANRALLSAVRNVAPARNCGCRDALKFAILTDAAHTPESLRRDLAPILSKYRP